MMNMNNDKMFVCDQCISETVRKSDLKRHIKKLSTIKLKTLNVIIMSVILLVLQAVI